MSWTKLSQTTELYLEWKIFLSEAAATSLELIEHHTWAMDCQQDQDSVSFYQEEMKYFLYDKFCGKAVSIFYRQEQRLGQAVSWK